MRPQTATPYRAAIHDQIEWAHRQVGEPGFGVGQEVDFEFDVVVAHPAGELFDLTLNLLSIGYLAGDVGQVD